MTIPSTNFSVKVGPYVFLVEYSKDIAAEGGVFGSTHCNDQKIFIDPTAPRQKQLVTFLHELLHACNFVNGVMYRFEAKDPTARPSEEDVVRETATILYQVIRDNPQYFQEKNDTQTP